MALDPTERSHLLQIINKYISDDWTIWPVNKFSDYEEHAVVLIPKSLNCLLAAIETLFEISKIGDDASAQMADEIAEKIYEALTEKETDEIELIY